MANVSIRDVRKGSNSWEETIAEGEVIKYTLYDNQLFLNLDTGYQIRIELVAIKDAISEIVSKEVLERLKGK